MLRILGTTLFLAVLLAPIADAQLTNPIRYTWIVTSCASWNCAAAALVMANGDKHVIVLPTGQESRPWVVLKRVEEGALVIDENETWGCETFEGVAQAATRFAAMDACHVPTILSVPDGRAVVISLTDCPQKRRATR